MDLQYAADSVRPRREPTGGISQPCTSHPSAPSKVNASGVDECDRGEECAIRVRQAARLGIALVADVDIAGVEAVPEIERERAAIGGGGEGLHLPRSIHDAARLAAIERHAPERRAARVEARKESASLSGDQTGRLPESPARLSLDTSRPILRSSVGVRLRAAPLPSAGITQSWLTLPGDIRARAAGEGDQRAVRRPRGRIHRATRRRQAAWLAPGGGR